MSAEAFPWLTGVQEWAEQNDSIQEVWLFGSQARGDATETSDVDLAITLAPPKGNHDWALGNYSKLGDQWQAELGKIVGCHVSLELMPCKLLWRRGGA
jgi:predicted nucleotidyltransferase